MEFEFEIGIRLLVFPEFVELVEFVTKNALHDEMSALGLVNLLGDITQPRGIGGYSRGCVIPRGMTG
jgi:murein endopeptidase